MIVEMFFHKAHVLFDPCAFVVQGLMLCPSQQWFVININQISVWWLVRLCGHFSDLCILVIKDVCQDGKYSLLPPVLVNISRHMLHHVSRAKMLMVMMNPLYRAWDKNRLFSQRAAEHMADKCPNVLSISCCQTKVETILPQSSTVSPRPGFSQTCN